MNGNYFAVLICGCALSAQAMAADCFSPVATQSAGSISVVAPEMAVAPPSDPYCVSADQALARLRGPATAPAGAYVPLTKDDNTPWRFDMSQNGKRMTSAEFDAWMKAKGIRVATGKPAANSTAEPAAGASAPAETGK